MILFYRLDNSRHIQYLRLTVPHYDHIYGLVRHALVKTDTVMREAIEPGLKFAVTLHHLAEGASHASIAAHYRLGRSTVSGIIYDTCDALWEVLQPIYMRAPSGPEEWLRIAEGWSFIFPSYFIFYSIYYSIYTSTVFTHVYVITLTRMTSDLLCCIVCIWIYLCLPYISIW